MFYMIVFKLIDSLIIIDTNKGKMAYFERRMVVSPFNLLTVPNHIPKFCLPLQSHKTGFLKRKCPPCTVQTVDVFLLSP